MNADLGFTSTMYSLGASIFFLGYCTVEVPSNLLLERYGARLWLARIKISWGVISASMALIKGIYSFCVLRALLGFAEAGLFPGVIASPPVWVTRPWQCAFAQRLRVHRRGTRPAVDHAAPRAARAAPRDRPIAGGFGCRRRSAAIWAAAGRLLHSR